MKTAVTPETEFWMGNWRPIDTIPIGEPVRVLTVTGIICIAKVTGSGRWIKRPDAQVKCRRLMNCRRLDGRTAGDVRAIGWKPLEQPATA